MYLERDGARLFYTTLGRGPDVVLLHPTPVHHEFWMPVARLLEHRYRFTLIDLRGHGASGAGIGTISMDKLAEDVHAILQASGMNRAGFAGCSIGAYAIYEHWRRYPGDMEAMAVICGKPQPDMPENREKRRANMESIQQPGGLAKFFDSAADTLIGPTARTSHPELRTTARQMMDRTTADAVLAIQQGLMDRPDSVSTLRTISIPVCAVAGGEDEGIALTEMRAVLDNVAGAEYHVIADAGHYAPLEQPGRIADILSRFFDRSLNHHSTGTVQA